MKKFLCVLLALTMIFALGACGGGDEKADKAPEEAVETPAEEAAAPEEAAEQPAESEPEEAPAEEPEEKDVTLGVVDGNTYESKYLGLGCTVPEGWNMLGPEQMQEIGDIVNGMLEDTDFANHPVIQDMYAINLDTGAVANIVLSKMEDMERAAMVIMTEEQIVENILANKDTMFEAYKQAGMPVTSIEADTFEFLGEEHHVVKSLYSVEGVDAMMIQVFNYHTGGAYGATITFSGVTEEDIAELAEMFYEIDR